MNDITHKSLMVEVERAVRPVRASQARKILMREELLAHLTAIFEEEIARRADEETAMQQARIRFGDPRELARELQQTTTRLDRLRFLLEKTGFRPDDSPLTCAIKYALGIMIMLALFVPLLLIMLSLNGRIAEFGMRYYIVAVSMSITMGFLMLGVIFIGRMRKTFFATGSLWFGVRAAIDILISLCTFPLLAFTNYALLTGDLAGGLKFVFAGCLFAPLAPVLSFLMARQYDREMRAQEIWSNLEIDV